MAFIQAVPWHSITTPTQRRNGTLRTAAAAGTPGGAAGQSGDGNVYDADFKDVD